MYCYLIFILFYIVIHEIVGKKTIINLYNIKIQLSLAYMKLLGIKKTTMGLIGITWVLRVQAMHSIHGTGNESISCHVDENSVSFSKFLIL